MLGIISIVVLTPIVFLAFNTLGILSLRLWPFVIFKAVVAAILAGLITLIVVKRALIPAGVENQAARR